MAQVHATHFRRTVRSVVVAAALATALSGCTVYQTLTKPTEVPQTTTAPTVSDQEQIRQVTAQMGKALGSLDLDAGNALTCPRYQVSSRTADSKLVPSINSWRGAEQALMYGDTSTLSSDVAQHFPSAGSSERATLVRAIVSRDEFAYSTTVLQVIRESTTVEKFAIDNIKIVGDSATGDITATYSFGGAGTQTQTKPNQFRKEGGKWAWCQQPPPGLFTQWTTSSAAQASA
ncbi:hypothetical protein EJ571_08455 [Mycobacteroides franklinii]|uniref:Uncharacterized protein n=1 Tax=Mycobacteroides franklinii TaxID=948102 RepID=A0A4R5PB97_9MYCO|nr:hypothetical protein EJ571_08455 [Mycobacteroides franklinii]TDZ43563.1 hypothetical protein CCUG64054_03621 [Mycobacteroides franklinii]TDZ50698.1 hypothetical protein CCUG63697_02207 [Mycobacteroides franklinii]TDZ57118.1 hypothetical protein CCUG63696_03623 [Mycobacteroides franklinii]TDZ64059.1 hypothetical protein CCUG63695_03548 [Mycobacteroides franklinii]